MTKFRTGRMKMLAALCLGMICMLPAEAWCHTFPRQSEPKVGATVDTAPSAVRIWFDADLEPAFSRVVILDAGGKTVDKGDCHVSSADPRLLEVTVQSLSHGMYTVKWDVVSRDGHHTNGDFMFNVK